MGDEGLVLAVDAGGSSSSAVLLNEDWQVLTSCSGGPINITQDDEVRIKENLLDLVEEILRVSEKRIQDFRLAIIGVSGWYSANWESGKSLIRNILRNSNFVGDIDIHHDSKTTWAGAADMATPSAVIYSGTGAFSFGVNNAGEEAYADILGPQFGDSGSGYWIGLRAIRRAIKSQELRGKRTSLESLLPSLFDTDNVDKIVKKVWQDGVSKRSIASLVPEVSEKARDGDLVSIKILEKAAGELGLSAKSVLDRLGVASDENFSLVYSGGVFKAGYVILEPLKEFISGELSGVKLEPPEYGPLVGSILLSCEERGLAPPKRTMKRLGLA